MSSPRVKPVLLCSALAASLPGFALAQDGKPKLICSDYSYVYKSEDPTSVDFRECDSFGSAQFKFDAKNERRVEIVVSFEVLADSRHVNIVGAEILTTACDQQNLKSGAVHHVGTGERSYEHVFEGSCSSECSGVFEECGGRG